MRTIWISIYSLLVGLVLNSVKAADVEPVNNILFPSPATPATPPVLPSDAPTKLLKGQFYIIRSTVPLITITDGAGEVSVNLRNGKTKPLTIPAELVVGWPADSTDPDIGVSTVTFTDEFLYILRPVKSGKVNLQVIPALNKTVLDKDGKILKLVPLTKKDIVNKVIDVDAGQGPQPPPTPVDPKVDPITPPKPVDPLTPNPPAKDEPNPFGETTGLRVLIIFNQTKITPDQYAVVYGKSIADLLEAKCPLGPDNKTREYRIYPTGTVVDGDTEPWKSAYTKYNGNAPYLIIGNGKVGYVGALKDVADTTTLINKFSSK